MSSCINLEFIKSPSSSWPSNSSSPSSTLESSNSQLTISTRKPRTPRKRPNQTYNEAFAILSTAHPKIFPTKNLAKFTTKIPFFDPPDLLMPLQVIDTTSRFLLHPPLLGPHLSKGFEKACEISSKENFEENFDAESILDGEIGEGVGIDSIMGKSSIENGVYEKSNVSSSMQINTSCYGYPMELVFGFEFGNGYGVRNELRAMRNVDEGKWWSFPSVNLLDLNPKMAKIDKKKKKKKVDILNMEPNKVDLAIEEAKNTNAGLILKLNYDNVLNEWSDKASPFSGDAPASEFSGNDVQARLAQIDLFSFSENGGIREASVLRYKEKRRTRLFSKKIRYQVRKVNADRRPRMKEV